MNKILFAVKVGEPDYAEQLITEVASRIPAASEWAKANGFDRLRVAEIADGAPDFTKVLNAQHAPVDEIRESVATVIRAEIDAAEAALEAKRQELFRLYSESPSN